jgi:3-methyladenine DNA glycosylase Tag
LNWNPLQTRSSRFLTSSALSGHGHARTQSAGDTDLRGQTPPASVPPGWKVIPPKDDAEYFERMSRALFTAGLSWARVEKKWPNFRKAFAGFSPAKVSTMTERDVKTLMGDAGIVRNEREIRATIHNAGEFAALKREFGSFNGYIASFGNEEERLQEDLQKKFQHVGGSTARMFLWSVGYKLTPTPEEKKWMSQNRD